MNMEHQERREWVQEIINQLSIINSQTNYGTGKPISQTNPYFR